MKIRNGFVSNSSSSSFIIDGKYNSNKVLEYAKEQTRIAAIDRFLDDAEYTLKDEGHTKYKYESTPWTERQLSVIKDVLSLDYRYSDRLLNDDIRIKTVGELRRLDEPDINIDEWYEGYDIPDDALVLYDIYDNFIPEEACEKIIKKFKCEIYNTHMG